MTLVKRIAALCILVTFSLHSYAASGSAETAEITSENIYTKRSHKISSMQALARRYSINVGNIDGRMGPKSAAAIEELSVRHGFPEIDIERIEAPDLERIIDEFLTNWRASDSDVDDCTFIAFNMKSAYLGAAGVNRTVHQPSIHYVTFPKEKWSEEWINLEVELNVELEQNKVLPFEIDGNPVRIRYGSINKTFFRDGGIYYNTHEPGLTVMSGTQCRVGINGQIIEWIGAQWYKLGSSDK